MTETTVWAHLPNASLIDKVLASVSTHHKEWGAARDVARGVAWDAARDAAWDAARDAWGAARDVARGAAQNAARGAAQNAAWDAAWDATWDATRGAARDTAWSDARDAAWDAIAALAAWDDAAHVIGLHPELVNSMRGTDRRAVLLYPAVLAFNKIGENHG